MNAPDLNASRYGYKPESDKLTMTINHAMRDVFISKEMEAGHTREQAEKIVEQLLSKTQVISA